MNPIFIEYYSHEQCNCYKIKLPWTEYRSETIVLCPVSQGYDKARGLAREIITRHFDEITEKELK